MSIANNTAFTYWTTIGEQKKINSQKVILCRCKCWTEKYVRVGRLLSGNSKSCGCWRNEKLTTHGQTKNSIRKHSHEYWIWNSMIQRTTNPKNSGFKNYGGRGVGVCGSWATFDNFFSDMGIRPSDKHSLERMDNNAGYSKENCRWATRVEQNSNRRNTRFFTANGKTKHLAEWARELGVSHATIINRIKRGWDVEKAVTTPARKMANQSGAQVERQIPRVDG